MNWDEAKKAISLCTEKMNALYEQEVFNEWTVLSIIEGKVKILAYAGPRREWFMSKFANDIKFLKSDMLDMRHSVGDFEFTREGEGEYYDAFIVLGDDCFLVCNNTEKSMRQIGQDSKWIAAQVPFAELSNQFRESPIIRPG